MRPLPSPLAQLSSRYNIVVYSEPRLRSVNHPSAPCPRWLYWQQPTLRSPNLPDAAARISRSIPFPFPVSTILPPSLPPFYPSNLSLPPPSLSLSLCQPDLSLAPLLVSRSSFLFYSRRLTASAPNTGLTNHSLAVDRSEIPVLFVPAGQPLIGIRELI